MSEKKPVEVPSRDSSVAERRTACAACGREDSGAWYWSERLQRVICIDCHWRDPVPPAGRSAVRRP